MDVDLDYFVDSDGRTDHTAADVMARLGPWSGKVRSWSGSLSVSSGFVPADRGTGLAEQLAQELGMPLRTPAAEVFTGTSDGTAPERSLAAAARGTPPRPGGDRAAVGRGTGHPGRRGPHPARCPRRPVGTHRRGPYRRPRRPAAAYVTGLAAMHARQHATALELFDLCTETVSDTLDAHAGILGVICALRLGRSTDGVQRARRALETTPLHRDLPGLLALAGRRSGDRGTERDAQRHTGILAEVWDG
ncbi:hypothetical protein ACWD4B_03875 [Streptomyces sp. NPDC002536]